MMCDFLEITSQRVETSSRKSWLRRDGSLGSVEEIVGDYYLAERRYTHYLLDSSVVYGGLLWVLFGDLLFHDNLTAHHPLRQLFYHQPRKGYERYRDEIEGRLTTFALHRSSTLQKSFRQFYAHPLFTDPRGQMLEYYGSWAKQHEKGLLHFCDTAPEHGMEDLIREILVNSSHGKNSGWPDLVIWNANHLIFSEVKARDQLSPAQIVWIQQHRGWQTVELVRVIEDT